MATGIFFQHGARGAAAGEALWQQAIGATQQATHSRPWCDKAGDTQQAMVRHLLVLHLGGLLKDDPGVSLQMARSQKQHLVHGESMEVLNRTGDPCNRWLGACALYLIIVRDVKQSKFDPQTSQTSVCCL